MNTAYRFHRRRAGAVTRALGGLSLVIVLDVADAKAQVDPLLFLKSSAPNILLVLDTANRMQRDAAEDYYDPFTYSRLGEAWEGPLGVTAANTRTHYRRKYTRFADSAGDDRFHTVGIRVVGDIDPGFAAFDARTRLGVARLGLARAVRNNQRVARFGLLKMRQLNPRLAGQGNEGPVLTTTRRSRRRARPAFRGDGASRGPWWTRRTAHYPRCRGRSSQPTRRRRTPQSSTSSSEHPTRPEGCCRPAGTAQGTSMRRWSLC